MFACLDIRVFTSEQQMNHLFDRADFTDDKAMHEIAVEGEIWDIFILNIAQHHLHFFC